MAYASTIVGIAAIVAGAATAAYTVDQSKSAAKKGRIQTKRAQARAENRAAGQERKNAMRERRARKEAETNNVAAIMASNQPSGSGGISGTNLTGQGTTTLGGGVG